MTTENFLQQLPPFKERFLWLKLIAYRLPWRGIFMLFFLAFVFWEFHEELKFGATSIVNRFGLGALFLLTIIADSVIQPVPPDVFVFGSSFGGANPTIAAFVAGIASTMGGMIGFFLGKRFGPWRFSRIFGRHLLRMGRPIFHNYGWLAIAVGAISPIPYSGVCWMAGIYNVSAWIVILTSLILRVPRFLLVGYIGSLS